MGASKSKNIIESDFNNDIILYIDNLLKQKRYLLNYDNQIILNKLKKKIIEYNNNNIIIENKLEILKNDNLTTVTKILNLNEQFEKNFESINKILMSEKFKIIPKEDRNPIIIYLYPLRKYLNYL